MSRVVRFTLVYDVEVDDQDVESVDLVAEPGFGAADGRRFEARLHFDDTELLETPEEIHAAYKRLTGRELGR